MADKTRNIFLDTSFLFAWLNQEDKFHDQAMNLIQSCKDKHVCFCLTDYIIDEILTLVLIKTSKKKAVEIAEEIMESCHHDPSVRLIYIQEPLFAEAMKIFCEFKDKNWSFTDCTSYVVMKNYQISEGASFDKHFREFGLKIAT
jgi:predicted nucleic acid-binding protein